jgi:glucose-6-phosphate 1-epimerase
MEWTVSEMAEGRAVLELLPSDESRKVFPRQFRLRFIVTVGQDGLTMALETTNTDPIPFTFGDALHTYFTVPDVRSVRVTGLKDHRYRSKTEGGLVKTDIHDATPLEGETDRVYFDTYGPHEIITPNPADGRVRIHKSNSSDTVLWNPWETKAESLPDLAGGQWKGFVCVEAVNTAENSVTLAPGQSHTTVCRIEAL